MAFGTETMLTGVDHIVVRCSNPPELMDEVRTQLDVPTLIPIQDYGDFCSGMIRLSNLDIEFLRLGAETIPKPYFYGIAFTSAETVWRTAAWLKAKGIRHSLPIHTTTRREGRRWRWSTIFLDGFLDNPIPAPYSLGMLSGDGFVARGVAAFSATLMQVPAIRRFTATKGGGSMCFVCHYDRDLSRPRAVATETLAASGGGKNQIVRVESIVVEVSHTKLAWERLLATRQIDNPKLEIQQGITNRIREVVIRTKVPISPMRFGDVVFLFQSE